ncbi:hypothetical protein FRC17_005378 [Serendipita sp. 399]|nr:hypothetical protein FRC17_005378 [Serendipita sp. 399]
MIKLRPVPSRVKMSMLIMFASGWWPFTITIISLLGPFVFKQLRAARREDAADDDVPRNRSARVLISSLLVLNAIYISYCLLLRPPPNIFSSLRIPFTTPAQTIRALLLQRSEPRADALPPNWELMLTKLASFEVRTMYSRFGHTVILNCEDCQTYLQFGLFALSTGLLDYIRNIVLYGFVTVRGEGRERLRLLGTGVLVTAAAFEAWWIATVEIQVPRDALTVIMWHDRLYTARQIIFLLVPTIAHNLPASPTKPISPLFLLSRTAIDLSVTKSKTETLDLTHSGAMRDPELRHNVETWWAHQRQEADWAKEDSRLEEEAERIKLGIRSGDAETGEEDGDLRARIRRAVQELGKIAWGWDDRGFSSLRSESAPVPPLQTPSNQLSSQPN